mgnify:CR=1 FL=1
MKSVRNIPRISSYSRPQAQCFRNQTQQHHNREEVNNKIGLTAALYGIINTIPEITDIDDMNLSGNMNNSEYETSQYRSIFSKIFESIKSHANTLSSLKKPELEGYIPDNTEGDKILDKMDLINSHYREGDKILDKMDLINSHYGEEKFTQLIINIFYSNPLTLQEDYLLLEALVKLPEWDGNIGIILKNKHNNISKNKHNNHEITRTFIKDPSSSDYRKKEFLTLEYNKQEKKLFDYIAENIFFPDFIKNNKDILTQDKEGNVSDGELLKRYLGFMIIINKKIKYHILSCIDNKTPNTVDDQINIVIKNSKNLKETLGFMCNTTYWSTKSMVGNITFNGSKINAKPLLSTEPTSHNKTNITITTGENKYILLDNETNEKKEFPDPESLLQEILSLCGSEYLKGLIPDNKVQSIQGDNNIALSAIMQNYVKEFQMYFNSQPGKLTKPQQLINLIYRLDIDIIKYSAAALITSYFSNPVLPYVAIAMGNSFIESLMKNYANNDSVQSKFKQIATDMAMNTSSQFYDLALKQFTATVTGDVARITRLINIDWRIKKALEVIFTAPHAYERYNHKLSLKNFAAITGIIWLIGKANKEYMDKESLYESQQIYNNYSTLSTIYNLTPGSEAKQQETAPFTLTTTVETPQNCGTNDLADRCQTQTLTSMEYTLQPGSSNDMPSPSLATTPHSDSSPTHLHTTALTSTTHPYASFHHKAIRYVKDVNNIEELKNCRTTLKENQYAGKTKTAITTTCDRVEPSNLLRAGGTSHSKKIIPDTASLIANTLPTKSTSFLTSKNSNNGLAVNNATAIFQPGKVRVAGKKGETPAKKRHKSAGNSLKTASNATLFNNQLSSLSTADSFTGSALASDNLSFSFAPSHSYGRHNNSSLPSKSVGKRHQFNNKVKTGQSISSPTTRLALTPPPAKNRGEDSNVALPLLSLAAAAPVVQELFTQPERRPGTHQAWKNPIVRAAALSLTVGGGLITVGKYLGWDKRMKHWLFSESDTNDVQQTKPDEIVLDFLKQEKANIQEFMNYTALQERLFQYNFTVPGKFNYKQIVNETQVAGINNNKTNPNYMMSEKDFRNYFNSNFTLNSRDYSYNPNYQSYLENLLNLVMNHKDIFFIFQGKSYLSVPAALLLIYNSMLGHIRHFDRVSFYRDYSREEIIKFVRLKTELGQIKKHIQDNFKFVKPVIADDDCYLHTTEQTSSGRIRLLDFMTQPYIEKNNNLYRNLNNTIQEYFNSFDTKKIVGETINRIAKKIEQIMELPLPIGDAGTESGKNLNKLSLALAKSINIFGNLYYYETEEEFTKNEAKIFKDRIIALAEKLNRLGSLSDISPPNKEALDNYFTVHQPESGEINTTSIQAVSANNKNFNETFRKGRDSFAHIFYEIIESAHEDKPLSSSSLGDMKNKGFITDVQNLLKNNFNHIKEDNKELMGTLQKFIDNKLTPADFLSLSSGLQDDFCNAVTLYAIYPTFTNKNTRVFFSESVIDDTLGYTIERWNNVSANAMLEQGEYARLHQAASKIYENEVISALETITNTLIKKELSNNFESYIDTFINNPEFLKIKFLQFNKNKEIKEWSLIDEEITLALKYFSEDIKANETVAKFNDRVITERQKEVESFVRDSNEKFFQNYRVPLATLSLQETLRENNLRYIKNKEEVRDRYEIMNYINNIVDKCESSKGNYTSRYLPPEMPSYNAEAINFAKIAAVRHLYKPVLGDNEVNQRTIHLNIYEALVRSNAADARRLRLLASSYWFLFYHPLAKSDPANIFPYLGSKAKNVANIINDKYKLNKLKAFLSLASSTRFDIIFNKYADIYQYQDDVWTAKARGEFADENYFSITKIKKRSEFPGNNLNEFHAQFKKYTQADISKDAKLLISSHIASTGIDPHQLEKNPKAIYAFKHLARPLKNNAWFVRDRLNPSARDNDLLIIVNQDNSVLISSAFDFNIKTHYFPASSFPAQGPQLADIPYIISNLTDHQFVEKEKEILKKRPSLLNLFYDQVEDYYEIEKGKFNYAFQNGTLSTDFLAIEDKALLTENVRSQYSWSLRPFSLFKKSYSSTSSSGNSDITNNYANITIKEILQRQMENYLFDYKEMLRIAYDDAQEKVQVNANDPIGTYFNIQSEAINTILSPFIEPARKWYAGAPLTDQDISLMIVSAPDILIPSINLGKTLSLTLSRQIKNAAMAALKAGQKLSSATMKNIFRSAMRDVTKGKRLIDLFKAEGSLMTQRELPPLPIGPGKYRPLAGRPVLTPVLDFAGAKNSAEEFIYNRYINKNLENSLDEAGLSEIKLQIRKMMPADNPLYAEVSAGRAEATRVEAPDEIYRGENLLDLGSNPYADRAYRNALRSSSAAALVDSSQTFEQLRAGLLRDGYTLYQANSHALNVLIRYEPGSQTIIDSVYAGLNEASNLARRVNNILRRLTTLDDNDELFHAFSYHTRNMLNLNALGTVEAREILNLFAFRSETFAGLFDNMQNRGLSNLYFFRHPTDNVIAFVNSADYSRTVFVNLDATASGSPVDVRRTLLHELSHFTRTADFVYQTDTRIDVRGAVVANLMPVSQYVRYLRSFQHTDHMASVVTAEEVRRVLQLHEGIEIDRTHYQTLFQAVHSPAFPLNLLKGNADTGVEFFEMIDRVFTTNQAGRVVSREPGAAGTGAARPVRSADNTAINPVMRDTIKKALFTLLYAETIPERSFLNNKL